MDRTPVNIVYGARPLLSLTGSYRPQLPVSERSGLAR